MIRFLEKNYRKMEEIIRVLSISDKWMTKKELARHIGSSESTFIRYIEEIKQRISMLHCIFKHSQIWRELQQRHNSFMNLFNSQAKRSIIMRQSISVDHLLHEN